MIIEDHDVWATITTRGGRIRVDASTMAANAALRAIVCRDSGECYREMLKRLATESAIAMPRT